MENSNKSVQPAPFSLRFTFEERAKLDQEAAGMSLAAYIKQRLFDPNNPPRKTKGKFPVKDHTLLSQILGIIGSNNIAYNLNELCKLAKSGSLAVTPETELELVNASLGVLEMRKILINALGLKE